MEKITDRLRLDGKVAIVTGGAGGIGAAYVRGLAEAGASVAVADLDVVRAEKIASELGSDGYAAMPVALDVTDPASADGAVKETVDKFGGLDILVNNAGLLSGIPRGKLIDIPLEDIEKATRINVWSMVVCSRAAVPAMRERGAGRIIHQGSNMAFGGGSLYRVTKNIVSAITATMAKELGPEDILVNAIAPGIIKTEEGFRSAGGLGSPERTVRYAAVPNPRPDRDPEDLVGALILLVSPAGDYINGQTIIVDGGQMVRL